MGDVEGRSEREKMFLDLLDQAIKNLSAAAILWNKCRP